MFFLIDKPLGITSFDVIRKLRKVLNIRKIGHAGTLDPLATGCLLIATENSTKLLHLLDDSKKEYIFTVCLSGSSESLDAGTEIKEIPMDDYIDKSPSELREFLLNQKVQIPPKYSALHIGGARAYDLARQGVEFTIKERSITVYEVEIISFEKEYITIRMTISSGGYIRSFGPIIGSFFGVNGGYIKDLRRTKIITKYSILSEDNSGSIDNPIEIPYGSIFHTIPTYEISHHQCTEVELGKNVDLNNIPGIINQGNIFLSHRELGFSSFGKIESGIYTVIRNNV